MRKVPCPTQDVRSRPTERILRMSCWGDSSKAKYRQRPPCRQISLAKPAASVVLAVPAVPVMRMLLPS